MFLQDDFWDDYTFKTLYRMYYVNDSSELIDCGMVKIMRSGLESGRTSIPDKFEYLTSEYCSLGQEQSYYETLVGLPKEVGFAILASLRDALLSNDIYTTFKHEKAFQVSLTRGLGDSSLNRFRSIVTRQYTQTRFYCTYVPWVHGNTGPALAFNVLPKSMPPTNIHALIGRNGVGKTTLLARMAESVCLSEQARGARPDVGRFDYGVESDPSVYVDGFANVVSVSFSAFDNFRLISNDGRDDLDVRYDYVGLRSIDVDPAKVDKPARVKTVADLTAEFVASASACIRNSRRWFWDRAIDTLASDPGFEALCVSELSDEGPGTLADRCAAIFGGASAGHRLVLLTMAKLIETVGERTLVLFDEPEGHLHPPLLGSFIRAISELLISRNGVAIFATHSPVVLQELPRACVWILNREGSVLSVDRAALETFGENVGTLTHEVFGLEVRRSGHHALIKKVVDEIGPRASYAEVTKQFDSQLGTEAHSIALALIESARADD